MIEDKQIKEMARDIACNIAWDEDEIPTVNCLETAKRLYCEGYRKASEVAREIFELVECAFSPALDYNGYTIKAYIAELKKKYTQDKGRDKIAEFGKYSPLSWRNTED
mgnify:CR=1 FL=1